MKIQCPHCHKLYSIPDDRLPNKKQISFPCPQCKGIITLTIDLKATSKKDSGLPETTEKKKETLAQTASCDDKQPTGEALKQIILKNDKDLPAMPKIVLRTREILSNSSSSFKDIADTIGTDQAIAAKILKTANSAYYGLSGMVSSIHQASVVLGFDTIGEVIIMIGSSQLLGDKLKGYDMLPGVLWKHSLSVAFGSKIIAAKRNPTLENDAFSAGLIHDAGKLVLDKYVFKRKKDFEKYLKEEQKSFFEAEKQILELDHTEIAFELCKRWKIPQEQATAIKYHHNPSESQDNELAYIINVANHIANRIDREAAIENDNACQNSPEHGALEFLNLQEEDIKSIMDEIMDSVENISKDKQQE